MNPPSQIGSLHEKFLFPVGVGWGGVPPSNSKSVATKLCLVVRHNKCISLHIYACGGYPDKRTRISHQILLN